MDFSKYKKSNLGGNEKEAKLRALMGLKETMASEIGKDLKGLKQVTVASNKPEGLEAGLEKAQEMVSDEPSEELEEEAPVISDDFLDDVESPEEIDALIQKLEMKKQMLAKE